MFFSRLNVHIIAFPEGPPMLAALPMYTFDTAANAALWARITVALKAQGIADVPDQLEEPDDYFAHWLSPDLLFSQACGYPLASKLKQNVTVIGTFVYGAEGCDGPRYASAFIAPAGHPGRELPDFRGTRVAYNGMDSQSGYNCLRSAIAPLAAGQPYFSETVETGAHYRSLQAVAGGQADLAAIDCVSLAGFLRHEPYLRDKIRIIGWSERVPGLPIITRGAADAPTIAAMRRALTSVVADPDLATIRERLFIKGFAPLDFADYGLITAMEDAAVAAGYPVLQ